MTNVSIAQKQSVAKKQVATGAIILLVVGALCTLFLSLFFSGFGYWDFPGLLIIAIALGMILTRAFGPRGHGILSVGVFLLLIGLAGLASFIGFVFLGLLQILSVIMLVSGVILLILAHLRPKKDM